MPNLYFCQPKARSQATLRAVLSMDDCQRLFDPSEAVSVGEQFPDPANAHEDATDFAVLYVEDAAASTIWRHGFYRFDANLFELSRRLLYMEK